jgi:hypothetical protein
MTPRHTTGESHLEEARRNCPRCDHCRGYICAEQREPSYEELRQEVERLQQSIALIMGYALTARRTNTREWMFGLEDAINRAAELAGDPDRAVCDSDGMSLWIKKAQAAVGESTNATTTS